MIADRVLLSDAPEPFSHYCDVVRAGDLVFVSGMVAVSPDRRVLAPGDVAAQARIAFGMVGRALSSVGASPADVVKMNHYLVDVRDEPELAEPRREFFGDTLPASVLVGVRRLVMPGLLYEVAVVAAPGRDIRRVTLGGTPTVPYCDVVRAGDLVFVSGRTSLDRHGEVAAPGDAAGQAELALDALGAALAAVDATVDDVVSVTNYLTNIGDRAAVNIPRQRFFGDTRPASVLIEVPALAAPGLLYEVEAVAVAGGEKRRLLLDDLPPPFSHYCDVVRSGDLVWVSGFTGVSATHEVQAPRDAAAQARIALEAVGRCLEAVGVTPQDVVRVNNYVVDMQDREAINVARQEFFGDSRPASFLAEISRLVVPGLLYEIEALAIAGAGTRR